MLDTHLRSIDTDMNAASSIFIHRLSQCGVVITVIDGQWRCVASPLDCFGDGDFNELLLLSNVYYFKAGKVF